MRELFRGIDSAACQSLKASIAILWLASFAGGAAADSKQVADHSQADVKARCDRLGGTFTIEGGGSYNCTYKDGNILDCNSNQHCIFTKPRAVNTNNLNVNLSTSAKLGLTTATKGAVAALNKGVGTQTFNGGTVQYSQPPASNLKTK